MRNWLRLGRRVVTGLLLFVAIGAITASSALADAGQTWLDWAYEPANAGIHAHFYYYATQAAAEVASSSHNACTNIWLGSQGEWEFDHDSCVPGGYEAYTDQLADPGTAGYPWAQSQTVSDYLWAWARYCNTC